MSLIAEEVITKDEVIPRDTTITRRRYGRIHDVSVVDSKTLAVTCEAVMSRDYVLGLWEGRQHPMEEPRSPINSISFNVQGREHLAVIPLTAPEDCDFRTGNYVIGLVLESAIKSPLHTLSSFANLVGGTLEPTRPHVDMDFSTRSCPGGVEFHVKYKTLRNINPEVNRDRIILYRETASGQPNEVTPPKQDVDKPGQSDQMSIKYPPLETGVDYFLQYYLHGTRTPGAAAVSLCFQYHR